MATIDDFISYAKGKEFDNRGNVNNVGYVQTVYPFAGQCVSLCQGFMKYFGCTVTARGNAVDWWRNYNSNGLSAYFTKSSSPSNGAIVVTNADPTYGHVGVYYNGQMLQQNVNGNPYAVLDRIYGTPYGYLIPNFLGTAYNESDLKDEHAYATLTVVVKKRRDTPTGMVVETLPAGKKIEYTQKWVGNGHRYISFVEHQADGASYRYFVAISGSEVQGQDLWATFEPYEDKITLEEEHGYAKFKVDNVNIRKASPAGNKAGLVNSGDVIEYSHKYVGNGHRYIVYQKEGSNYFVACSPSEERSTEWCDFYSEDPSETKKDDGNPGTDNPTDTDGKPDYTKNVKHYGIDISEHNGNIACDDYSFVILRSNWWTTTDKKFEQHADKLDELGIPYGVYCYDYCGDEETALEQAKYTHNLIKNRDIKLGVWMDMEDADGWKKKNNYLTKEHCTMVCKVFCDYFKEQGYYTGIYASSSWFGNYISDLDYPKWIANWGTNDGTIQGDFSSEAVMHQYTSIDKDTGVNIDKDVLYIDISEMASNPKKEDEEKPKDDSPSNEKPESPDNKTTGLIQTLLKLLIELFKRILGKS